MKIYWDKMIGVFAELGDKLGAFGQDEKSRTAIAQAVAENPWFTTDGITNAIAAIRDTMLDEETLRKWTAAYRIVTEPKDIGVIMAGNIPAVGFFDLLCVLIIGHRLHFKPSSKDHALITYIISELKSIEPRLPIYEFSEQGIDAIIATGSDNTNRYFRSRYGHIPAVFRGSRSSVAVLDGDETDDELAGLATDIFTYSGLGCRNVSHLIVPPGYDSGRLTEALDSWQGVNLKYLNNFRQRTSMLEVQDIPHRKGNFYILREDGDFPAYVSEVTWHTSPGPDETERWLATNDNRLQCVAGRISHPRRVAFGQSQSPRLTDYPDAVDTMVFLGGI